MNERRYKDETDWNDLLRKPEKLFGYSYVYFLAILIVIGLLYIANINTAGRNSVMPAAAGDSSTIVQDVPLQSPRTVPPIDIMKASVPGPDLIAKGSELFKAQCSSCHGEGGLGDGPTASMLNPKPRSFHSLAGWKNGSKIAQMYTTLEEGIPGSAMPSYKHLTPAERIALIHFIRSLVPGQPEDSAVELRQLDQTFGLSKGMNVAGQIPVKKAMRLAIDEEKLTIEKVNRGMAAYNRFDGDGPALVWRLTRDQEKTFVGILKNPEMLLSADSFMKRVSANPDHYGFHPAVVRLSQKELDMLLETLRMYAKMMER